MALYLGNEIVQINLNGIVYCLNLFSSTPIINGIRLLSSDNYILQDSNGLYLIAKESSTPIINSIRLLSFDNYILQDSNGLYLTAKESE